MHSRKLLSELQKMRYKAQREIYLICSPRKVITDDDIAKKLNKLSPTLSNAYKQITIDLEQDDRLSYAGTAHEIREILRISLEILAPDEDVSQEPWYKQEPGTFGPTKAQRLKYILGVKKASSHQKEIIGEMDIIEKMTERFVVGTYARASDAAHRLKDKEEVKKILGYFQALVYDILD